MQLVTGSWDSLLTGPSCLAPLLVTHPSAVSPSAHAAWLTNSFTFFFNSSWKGHLSQCQGPHRGHTVFALPNGARITVRPNLASLVTTLVLCRTEQPSASTYKEAQQACLLWTQL